LPVAAAAASLAVLILFAFSMATLAGRLSQERTKLQEVVSFFRLFFERAGPWVEGGRNLSLREAVDQNAAMIEQGLEDQPAVKVEIASVLGDIYLELGQPDQALAWSETTLALHRSLAGEGSQDHSRGQVRVGAALRELGRYEESEIQIRAGLQRLQAQVDAAPLKVVNGLNNLVLLLCYLERYEEADEESVAALRLAEEQLEETSPEALEAIANRGVVLRQLGHTEEAQRLYERAIGLYRQSFGSTHPHVATLLLNLSSIYRDQGDLVLAQRTLEEANDQYREMFGPDFYGRVLPLVGLATLATKQENIDEALAFYREAIEVGMASNVSPAYVLRPALEVAELILESDRCLEGEQILRASLRHCEPHADLRWRYAEVEGLLGECLARRQLHSEARSLMERSSKRLQDHVEADPEAVSESISEARRRALLRLATFYEAIGDEAARRRAAAAQQSLGL